MIIVHEVTSSYIANKLQHAIDSGKADEYTKERANHIANRALGNSYVHTYNLLDKNKREELNNTYKKGYDALGKDQTSLLNDKLAMLRNDEISNKDYLDIHNSDRSKALRTKSDNSDENDMMSNAYKKLSNSDKSNRIKDIKNRKSLVHKAIVLAKKNKAATIAAGVGLGAAAVYGGKKLYNKYKKDKEEEKNRLESERARRLAIRSSLGV